MTSETTHHDEAVHLAVQRSYALIAEQGGNSGCCAPKADGGDSGCCAPQSASPEDFSKRYGYSEDDLSAVPDGANLGLGCGNPQALASIQPGETVVDLGSGAGFDCFLAAGQLKGTGQVIGVDMTPEMLHKARANAEAAGWENVEFRLGEIEHLPIADHAVDVIISNCVVNLSPDKPQVFREAFRVLKHGGRLAISDTVATADIPAAILKDEHLLCGCVSGAAHVKELRQMMIDAGFIGVVIEVDEGSRDAIADWAPGSGVEKYVASAKIRALKPEGKARCCG